MIFAPVPQYASTPDSSAQAFVTVLVGCFSLSAMSMKSKIKSFFGSARQYAVVGASNNPSKFGFKILSWYVQRGLPVVPINPKESEILGQTVIPSVRDLLEGIVEKKDIHKYKLASVDGVSISFLTPPEITVSTLEEIASVSNYKGVVKGIWLQPGSYDRTVLAKIEEVGLSDIAIHEDECILVRGDEGMYAANL